VDPRGARLSLRQYLADDGARQDLDAVDGMRGGARCMANPDSATGAHCTPVDRAYVEYFFSDSGCATPAALHPGYAQDTCGRVPNAIQGDMFYEVGARITTPIYEGHGAQCATATPDPTDSFYALGAPLPLSSLPSLALTNEGSGRVRLQVARSETAALIQTLGFFDGGKGVFCYDELAADGQQRCIPATQLAVNTFTDAQCTQGLVAVGSGGTAPAAGAFASAGIARPDGSATAVFQVGAKVPAPAMAWHMNGSVCAMIAVPTSTDFYVATAVAPSDLALVVTAPE